MNTFNQAVFGEQSLLKFLEFKINDTILVDEDIISCQITWDNDKFGVEGNLTIKDNLDLMNYQQLGADTTMTIYVKSNLDVEYQRTFKITEMSDTKIQEKHKVLQFNFIDEIWWTLRNTYISKSYKDAKITDIFKDYWNYLNIQELDTEIELNIQDTEIIHDFIVVPQNMSFLDWFKLELIKEGYVLFQDRYSVNIKKSADLIPTKLEKLNIIDEDDTGTHHKLTQNAPSTHYMFKIHDLETKFNQSLRLNVKSPVSEVQYYDFDTKSILSYDTKLSDIYDFNKLNTYDNSDMEFTNGKLLYTQQHQTEKEKIKLIADEYSNNSEIAVVLVGNLKYNKFYFNYDVDLSGNLMTNQGQNEGDIVMSGTYTCNKVIDRYFGNKLVQKMYLSRIDFSEKI